MSARAYRSNLRRSVAQENRSRIIEAARSLLVAGTPGRFTIDAVADAAGVARMTLYHQFGSKRGLIEALLDDLAVRGGVGRLPDAFKSADAFSGLQILVEVFTGFWASQGALISRLRAFSAFDPELGQGDRNSRRLQALKLLIGRLSDERGQPDRAHLGELADLIQALTSFEAYLSLNRDGRDEGQIAALITAACARLLGV